MLLCAGWLLVVCLLGKSTQVTVAQRLHYVSHRQGNLSARCDKEDPPPPTLEPALVQAARQKDLAAVRQLLATRGAVDAEGEEGATALNLALKYQHDKAVEVLKKATQNGR